MKTPNTPLLYVITAEATVSGGPEHLLRCVESALRGGAGWLQYRDKWKPAAQKRAQAQALRSLCSDYDARLIINDDPELAAACGADGVHVGASDASVASARALLGPQAIVGATCGDSLARARAAITADADYVAFGRLYPSRTKPDAPAARLETLDAARAFGKPVCGIGGILPQHVAEVTATGTTLLAVIDGVFGSNTPEAIEQAARRYTDALNATSANRHNDA